jgi:uncharacterized protein (TIGR03435 family)
MPVTASFVIVAAATVAVAQDMGFQTATITRNKSGTLSGGSQILPEGKVIITNTSVRDLLRVVYDVPDFAIIGAPDWFASERYDITAQAAGKPSRDELKQMMRTLLAEQFKLVLHQEARSLPVFELRRSRTDGSLGPNLLPSKTSCEIGGTAACPHELTGASFTAAGMAMARIVRTLAELAGRPVIDKTNLSGLYDVKLTWTPGRLTFLAAVRDQLGLELEARDEPAQVLVIDSVGRLISK